MSGDGIDQDDLIGFLGVHLAGLALGTGVQHAPAGIRDDVLAPLGARLRYVSCPFQPARRRQRPEHLPGQVT